MKKCALTLCFVLSLALTNLYAASHGIKVVSDKNPDASSIETILKDILKPDMSDQQKCEAIFEYLVTHLYHMYAVEEPVADMLAKRKAAWEVARMTDSVKQLNIYAHGLCGSQSRISCHVYNAAGFLSRVCGVQGHTTFEVKYDGAWHYFDVDMMGFVRDKSGKVVSIDQIRANRNLILKKHAKTPKYYFKFDRLSTMYGCLRQGVRYAMYGRKMGVHSMNLRLKDGEVLNRYFKRQWAPNYRYYCEPIVNSRSKHLKRLKQGPARDKAHYLFTEAGAKRYGNWELIYTPKLSKKSFLDDAFKATNVKTNSGNPLVASDKKGPSEIIMNVYSPYGCAGAAGNLSTNDDDKMGYVIEGEFNTDSGEVAYSFDLGKSWVGVHKGGGKFKLDLTPKFVCQYGWMLKLSFDGDKAGLNSFKSYISGQLSPASLPFVDGKTEMTFSRDETDCMLLRPDLGIGAENFKQVAHKVEGLTWQENAIAHLNGNGSVIYKIDAPGDITRVQAGALFNGRKGTYSVSFSLDDGASWILAGKQKSVFNEKKSEEYWAQALEGIIDFDLKKAYSPGCIKAKWNVWETAFEPKPVKSILVKFTQQGGRMSKVHGIYAHYKKPCQLPLEITHKWNGGEHVEKIKGETKTKEYSVSGGAMKDNLSISFKAGE